MPQNVTFHTEPTNVIQKPYDAVKSKNARFLGVNIYQS